MSEMQYQFPGVSAETKALVDACKKNFRFEPLRYPHLGERPDWWLVRPEEIIEICRSVKKGRTEIIAESAAGLPVYAVYYGDFSKETSGMNWSAVTGCDEPGRFCIDREKQMVMFLAGTHGAEPESVIAALNLIVLKETGKDMLGRPQTELMELLENYELIIVPCLNMDGRYIAPDHLNGATDHEFRVACQGCWPDGNHITWRESKRYFPLPLDKVDFPGGYPNSLGYNLMHDTCPGHIRSAEVNAFLQLMERYVVDFVLNGHSCESWACICDPSGCAYAPYEQRCLELSKLGNEALVKAGLHPAPGPQVGAHLNRCTNINNLIPLACGGIAVAMECNSYGPDFATIMEPNFVVLRAILKDALQKPFVDRARLIACDPDYVS